MLNSLHWEKVISKIYEKMSQSLTDILLKFVLMVFEKTSNGSF